MCPDSRRPFHPSSPDQHERKHRHILSAVSTFGFKKRWSWHSECHRTKTVLPRLKLAIHARRWIKLSLSTLFTPIEQKNEILQMSKDLERRKYRLHQISSQVQGIRRCCSVDESWQSQLSRTSWAATSSLGQHTEHNCSSSPSLDAHNRTIYLAKSPEVGPRCGSSETKNCHFRSCI